MSSLLPSFRRQPANRSNTSPRKPRVSTLAIRRLSILPEEDEHSSSPSSSRTPSPVALPVSPKPANLKRLSRYGRENMLAPLALGSGSEDFTFERPRPAPRPPVAVVAPTPSRRQSIRLSAFDFDIPASSLSTKRERRLARLPESSEVIAFSTPPSPTLSSASDVDVPFQESIRLSAFPFEVPTDLSLDSEPESPLRAPSPASSMSSNYTSTSSSSSDLPLTPTSSDDEWPIPVSPASMCKRPAPVVPIRPLVINKAPRFPPVVHDEHEDDATWYARELGSRFALLTPPASATFAGPESLPPPATGRSRHSKPLPALPHAALLPSVQLDPTFAITPRVHQSRKNLRITVPHRPPPQRPVPADVGDIFEDGAAWAPPPRSAVPSSAVSLPRLPESPCSTYEDACFESVSVDAPVAVNGDPETPAVAGPVPAIVVSEDALAEDTESIASFPLLRSRWSSSTLASLAADTPGSAVMSPKMISFHIGAVARRVVRRSTGRAQSVAAEVCAASSPRSSCESDDGSSESGDSTSSSGLRRKAIPVELFMR